MELCCCIGGGDLFFGGMGGVPGGVEGMWAAVGVARLAA